MKINPWCAKAPLSWHSHVQSAVWYQRSCFMYCIPGAIVIMNSYNFKYHFSAFPWQLFGTLVFLNGFASYMSDVVMWGRASIWKYIDKTLATLNTVLCVIIALSCGAGYASFSFTCTFPFVVGLILSICCKLMANNCVDQDYCNGFLFWHSLWHICLPLGATVSSLHVVFRMS